MSYRMIALASCFVALGCGAAPPPPAATVASKDAEAKEAAPQPDFKNPGATGEPVEGAAKDGGAHTRGVELEPAAPGGAAGGSAGGTGAVNQAVVDSKEPLGGKLSQEDIRKIIEKSGDLFGDCYTLGAGGKNKDFKATVTVKATIGPSGSVNVVQVTKSTANNSKVDACVSESFKRVKFPRPKDGGTSVVTFPVGFNGVEQVQ